MQNNRFSKLSISIKSKGRFYAEKKSILRSPYQRDRDRIIHSTAFRRLKHKTQVFVNTIDDHYRTRLTHSLEVSQIARTLGKIFNLKDREDICFKLPMWIVKEKLGQDVTDKFSKAQEVIGKHIHSVNILSNDLGGADA